MDFGIKNDSAHLVQCSADEIIEELIDFEKEITTFETTLDDINDDDIEEEEAEGEGEDGMEENDDDDDENDVDDADIEFNTEGENYIWSYFTQNESKNTLCKLCKNLVDKEINVMLKHLKESHGINKSIRLTSEISGRGRPSRSFIWKYCSRQNQKQAFCHICNKLLFFGGGNTSNIAKHLRRRHIDLLEANELGTEKGEGNFSGVSIQQVSEPEKGTNDRKDKKSGSYVWNYCEKIDKRNVKCNLCNKVMSYHGTANVITHLARVHRVNGKDEKDGVNDDEQFEIVALDNENTLPASRKGRGATNPCNVWKYCKRLTKDIVRCGICNKKFSFQGTSNLQRHLQRMHGVDSTYRPASSEDNNEHETFVRSEVIWQFCEKLENREAKCNICNFICSLDDISRHMIQTHAIYRNSETSSSVNTVKGDHEIIFENNLSESEMLTSTMENKTKETLIDDLEVVYEENESLLHDMIEIDPEDTGEQNNDVFDLLQEYTDSLSSDSSDAEKPSQTNTTANTERLQELRSELLASETEYYREKAAYYRMQKYLAALKAKKARLELASNATSTTINGHYIINPSVSRS